MQDAAPTSAQARRCTVCGDDQVHLWRPSGLDRPLNAEDLKITDHRYGLALALYRCRNCDLRFADADDLKRLASIYEELDDPEYEQGMDPRRLQMRALVRRARKHSPGARTALDVGAGLGLLVDEVRRHGLEAEGVEPSRYLVKRGAATLGVRLHQGTFPHPDLSDRRFDLIFLVDVIEHVAEPAQLLAACAAALNPGGHLLVVTPDLGSVAARIMRRRWWHFRLAHVMYFNRKSLSAAARRTGLAPVAWFRPCWFFPVRYLALRAAEYLPVGRLNRWAELTPPLRWLYDRTLPLNLRDSLGVVLRRASDRVVRPDGE